MKILNTMGELFTLEARTDLEDVAEVDYKDVSQEELLDIIDQYDAILVGLSVTLNSEVLKRAKKLKTIATATTGLNHIDINYANERGIEVLSLRGEKDFLDTITGTAELAVGLMIDLMRQTPFAFDDVKKYRWDRDSFRGHNLSGATLGVMGMGRLGSLLAKYGKAFDMNVIFYDPHVEESPVVGCNKVGLEELMAKSDVISIHIHLMDETKGMLNKDLISKMKKTAYLINTSRGEIVDEEYLLKAIKGGELAGYGTDVLDGELNFDKSFSNHPLVEHARDNRNVIIVPHIGGMTYESRELTDNFIARKLAKHLK